MYNFVLSDMYNKINDIFMIENKFWDTGIVNGINR